VNQEARELKHAQKKLFEFIDGIGEIFTKEELDPSELGG
jgi:hypothetical protein